MASPTPLRVCRSARICCAHFLCEELEPYFGYDNTTRTTDRKVFFFTLVDINCARSLNERKVDLKPIACKLQRGLADCIGRQDRRQPSIWPLYRQISLLARSDPVYAFSSRCQGIR
ncbi:hypothetical protein BSZ21_18750 [Bradyrhizobium canariense]|nr:hypothetical protein BSZ21_18750 [Bradyrhizobium canariense]